MSPARTSSAKGDVGDRLRTDRRSQLLQAGLTLFSRRPYDDVSVSDLANEAMAAHGLVSYYFGGKRGLYLAVLGLVLDDLNALTLPRPTGGSPAEQIKGMTRRHLEYFGRHPQVMLGLLSAGPNDPEARAMSDAAKQSGRSALLALLGYDSDPPVLLQTAIGGCMGFTDQLTLEWLTTGKKVKVDRLVDLCFDVMVAALESVRGHHVDMSRLDAEQSLASDWLKVIR
jgi:AcrR family transcriptional regulator